MIANEVAKLAGVNNNVARYYSRIGLLNPTRNPNNGPEHGEKNCPRCDISVLMTKVRLGSMPPGMVRMHIDSLSISLVNSNYRSKQDD